MLDKKQKRYDLAYLRMAQTWGELSHCKRKKVGALIVKDKMIISDGYNGTPSGFENACEEVKGDEDQDDEDGEDGEGGDEDDEDDVDDDVDDDDGEENTSDDDEDDKNEAIIVNYNCLEGNNGSKEVKEEKIFTLNFQGTQDECTQYLQEIGLI